MRGVNLDLLLCLLRSRRVNGQNSLGFQGLYYYARSTTSNDCISRTETNEENGENGVIM